MQSIKALCLLRGNLIAPGTHYAPRLTQWPANKSTLRLNLEFEAVHQWTVEHMKNRKAHFHEQGMHENPIFVWESADSRGTIPTGKTGQPLKNLWVEISLSMTILKCFPIPGLEQTQMDRYQFVPVQRQKRKAKHFVKITVDKLLVVESY